MKTTRRLPIVGLLLSLLTLANTGQGQALSPFTQWARAHAIPLGRSRTSTSADLRRFATVVGDARVVALGEPAHGAEEPLAFRNRLFRYLVEHHGFTAIAIESSLPDSRRVDAYINGAPGDAQDVARNHIGYGFGELRTSVELLEWMRAYNAEPGHKRRLHFYGIDLALGGAGGGTPRPVAFLDPLTLLARVDSAAASRLHSAVAPLLRLTDDSALSASPAQLDTLTLATDELLRRLERARPLLVAQAPNDYEWGYRTAVGAHQAIWVQRVLPKESGNGGGIPPGAWEAIETRDAAMADNVQWAMSREGPRGRMLVFAHNGHVMNAVNRGSIWDALAKPPKMMGVHLRSMFGRDIVIIGQSGGAYSDTAVKVVPDTAGLDEALGAVGLRHFAVDLRATRPGTPERRWLEVVRPVRANIRHNQLLRPIEAFDAIVYVDTLRPAARVMRTPSQSSPFDASYVVTAEPLDVGLPNSKICIAVAARDREGIWWWEPGRSGCGSRSTGPGVFHAWEAVVVPASDGTIDAKFKIALIGDMSREIALRLEGARIRALSTGALVPIQRRSNLDIGELPP